MAYTDILYEKKSGVAWITINRPEVRNAFRTTTVAELTLQPADGRGGASQRDPAHSQARDRDGERIRGRRRPRAARALRSLDRRRQRDLRPDRAARRQRGRGTRHRLPGARRRREEGTGDLVSLPTVLGPGRAGDGARQQGGPAQGSPRRGGDVVRGAARQAPDRAGAGQAVVQHRLRAESRRGAVRAHRARSLLPDRRGDGRTQRVRREAAGRLQEIPNVTKGASRAAAVSS